MGSVIVVAVLAVVVFFAARSVWKNHKNGECPGGCAGCSNACNCYAHRKETVSKR